jgi:hypothetical protein
MARQNVPTALCRGRGDNFDFSKFSKIIPVVCTPAKVYVPIGLATAEVQQGLRAASSVAELAAWLGIERKTIEDEAYWFRINRKEQSRK